MKTILAIAVALWPIASGAVEVNLGAGSEVVYDSNVFRKGDDDKGDGSVRITPTIGLVQRFENLELGVLYRPTYEAFMTYTEASGLTHYLYNGVDYRINPKTTVELTNTFRIQDVLNFGEQETVDVDITPVPNNDIARETMLMNDTSFNLSRAISARWTSDTDFTFSLFDPKDRQNTVGSKTFSAFQNFNYAMNSANQFGIGGGVVAQMFDSINTLPGSTTTYYRLFGTYQRTFGEATTLTVQLGPAFILTDQDSASGGVSSSFPSFSVDDDTTVGELRARGIDIDFGFGQGLTNDTVVPAGSVVVPDPFECVGAFGVTVLLEGNQCSMQLVLRNDPGIPSEFNALGAVQTSETEVSVMGSNKGADAFDFAIFGEVALTHNWTPNLYSRLAYNRNQSNAAGQGASTIADTVAFSTQWFPNPLWDVSLRASYVKRTTPTDLSRTYFSATRDPSNAMGTLGLVMLDGNAIFVEDSVDIDTNRFEIAARAARRMTQNITVSAWAGYSYQDSRGTGRSPNNFNDFSAMIGLKYDFDPFQL